MVDVRRNHGGSPRSVARLLSHFLPPRTHLNDFIARGDVHPKVASSSYTVAVPAPHFRVPLYVLVSHVTVSAGEEFAYDVQAERRGTLVGTVTRGGANPGSDLPIDRHFSMFVPNERARNAVTGTNWEGTGVRPDVRVPASRALATAYGMALAPILAGTSMLPAEHQRAAAVRAKLGRMSDAAIFAL